MPKEITKTLYTFKELLELNKEKKVSARAIEKARAWLQEGATNHDWWDFLYEEWIGALESIGFLNVKINFSGFWSQGDGASFTSDADLTELIKFMSSDIESSKDPSVDTKGWIAYKAEGVRTNPKYSHLLWIENYLSMSVNRISSHYCHANACSIEAELQDTGENIKSESLGEWLWKSKQPRLVKLWKSFVEDVERLRLDICHAIYKDLEESHEWLTADEQLIETSESNEYYFDTVGDFEPT